MAKRQGLIPLRDRVAELERIYYAVEKEIARELSFFDINNYQELRAIKTQERIDQLVKMLNRAAIKWAKSSVPEAYKSGYDISRTRLEILGAKRNEEFPLMAHRNAIGDYTDKTMNDLIRANLSIKQNVATFLYLARRANMGLMQFQAFDLRDEEIIAGLLDEAMEAGETRGTAYRLIREHFREKFGDAQFIRINNRNYNLKYYARNVARTRLRVVQTEAVKNSCAEFDNDLVEISDHGTTCEICIPYEGNVYSLSGRTPGYPVLDDAPPYHCQCEHSMAPTSEEALEWREKYAGEERRMWEEWEAESA